MNPVTSSTPLITLAQAQRILRDTVQPGPSHQVSLEYALGCVLAQNVLCDVDMPPFSRAMMDGYAVRAADVANPGARLECIGQIAAGVASTQRLEAGMAMQINTGAPLPPGADAVVPVEDTQLDEASRTVTVGGAYPTGKHITPRATYVRAHDRVLKAGMRIGPAQVAVAATAGAAEVTVYRRPSVAVLATGDELVHHSQKPTGAQIRNSNSPMLEALLRADGVRVISLGVATDNRETLHEKITAGLEHDCLCITGGVSMGQFDFVPEILNQCGVRFAFQKVAIRPGKPTAFGVTGSGKCVFALPGNPISAYVGYLLFVRPALAIIQGQRDVFPATIGATLDGNQAPTGNRDSFWPAKVTVGDSGNLIAQPLKWSGSGDPFGMAGANAFIVRPAQSPAADTGVGVQVMMLETL